MRKRAATSKRVRQLCGPGKSDEKMLLRVRNCLAMVYARLGHLEEAERECDELVAVQVKLHQSQETHPDVLLVRNNYAGVLQRQKRYAETLEVQLDVFAKAVPEPDKEGVMWPRIGMFGGYNLAESYRLWAEEKNASDPAGMLEKAEKMHQKVLTQREKQFGEVWPTWVSRVNLGMVQQAPGRTEQARSCYVDLDKLAEAVGESNATVKMAREKCKELSFENE